MLGKPPLPKPMPPKPSAPKPGFNAADQMAKAKALRARKPKQVPAGGEE